MTQSHQEKRTTKGKQRKSPKIKPADYMRYTGMASVMALILAMGALVGRKLDSYFGTSKPYLTLLCVVLALFLALYIILRDLVFKKAN